MRIEFVNSLKDKVFTITPLIGVSLKDKYVLLHFIFFGVQIYFKRAYEDCKNED